MEREKHYQKFSIRIFFHNGRHLQSCSFVFRREDTGMNEADGARDGEHLLQFLLADQACYTRDPPLSQEFLQQLLSRFDIRIREVELHVLEKNYIMHDRVIIGTFFLNFEREGAGTKRKVYAQGIFTVRDSGREARIKFTSPAYTFTVHFQKDDTPAVTLVHGSEAIRISTLIPDPARN